MYLYFSAAFVAISHATADAQGQYALPVPGAWGRTSPATWPRWARASEP